MAIPVPPPSPEGKYQVAAFVQRIRKAIGFFVVPMPGSGKPSTGTGTLLQWHGRKYFVSALHCFFPECGGTEQVMRSWNEARFGFQDENSFGRVDSLHEAVQQVSPDIGRRLPVSRPEDLIIDSKHDLIAFKIDTNLDAIAHAEWLDLESEAFTKDLTAGVSLFALGAPFDSQVSVPGFGQTLIPQLDHVRFDPDIDISGMEVDNYSSSYFYMPYSLTQEGINPQGFSGAPVFVNNEPPSDGVWTVSPRMVGVVQRFSRKKGILIARKVSAVIDLLD